jgi:hypothetical protein
MHRQKNERFQAGYLVGSNFSMKQFAEYCAFVNRRGTCSISALRTFLLADGISGQAAPHLTTLKAKNGVCAS